MFRPVVTDLRGATVMLSQDQTGLAQDAELLIKISKDGSLYIFIFDLAACIAAEVKPMTNYLLKFSISCSCFFCSSTLERYITPNPSGHFIVLHIKWPF